jgi:hypothetical protein
MLQPARLGQQLIVVKHRQRFICRLYKDVRLGTPDEGNRGVHLAVWKADVGLGAAAHRQGEIRVRTGTPTADIVNNDVAGQIFS